MRVDRAGYFTVRLSSEGRTVTKYLHRLLAEAFIPNPEGLKFVNHIDGNIKNNKLNNLEWVSHSQNIQHAYDTGLIDKSHFEKPVVDTITGIIYKSCKEAALQKGIKYSTCKNYLNGRRINPTSLKYLS
jgi:HNH endonuclease